MARRTGGGSLGGDTDSEIAKDLIADGAATEDEAAQYEGKAARRGGTRSGPMRRSIF